VNLWLRLIWVLIATRFRPPLESPFGVSSVGLMVFPNDLDINLHMNNGRYLTIMDIGRLDLFIRGGLLKAIRGAGWRPVLSAVKVRFRRELRLWRRFRVESRVVFWEHTTFVMEHRIIIRGVDGLDVIAAISLNRGGLHDPKRRRFVPVAELFGLMNIDAPSPPATEDVRAFLDAEAALKRIG
jgi:acyl-CoA thioesterase FadM